MLSLDDARWSSLSDAYGASSGIPKLLEQAEKLPEDAGGNVEPYFSLWSALCHQGDVYSASYAALPHLVRIVEDNPSRFRWTLLALVHAIEVARSAGNGPPVPDDLSDPYQASLRRIPTIAIGLLKGDLSELELRVILAACASAKGFPSLGEAITELTPEITTRLLEDWLDQ
ncbi:MAG: hypothetical protein AABZ53_08585 [Planctomycetota bacterium]